MVCGLSIPELRNHSPSRILALQRQRLFATIQVESGGVILSPISGYHAAEIRHTCSCYTMNHTPTTEFLPPDAAAELRELQTRASCRERAVLRAYVSQGTLGAVGSMRFTPLHIAAMYQCVALTRELLQQGADPGANLKPQDLTNYPGCLAPPPRTPLLWMLNNLTTWGDGFDARKINRIIDLLVQHGADVRGREGGQALYYCAAARIDGSEEIFLHLLDLGARTHIGYLPEQALCCHGMVLYAGFERAAERLIAEGGIDINGLDTNGERFLTRTLYTVGRFYACSIPCFDEETAENSSRRNLISRRLLLEQGAEGINDEHPR